MSGEPMTLAEILEEIALGDETGKGLGGQGIYAAIRWLVRENMRLGHGPETYCEVCGLAIFTQPTSLGDDRFVHERCHTP